MRVRMPVFPVVAILLLALLATNAEANPTTDVSFVQLDHGDFIWASIIYSPDGEWLLVPSSAGIRMYDAESLVEEELLPIPNAVAIEFSEDGTLLAILRSQEALVWDFEGRREIATFPREHADANAVAFSPDKRLLAVGTRDSELHIWAVESDEQVAILDVATTGPHSAAFSPDGRLLATCDDSNVYLWDTETWELSELLNSRHVHGSNVVTFSPDGQWLALGARYNSLVALWDMQARKRVIALEGHQDRGLWGVDFSPDGKTLASGGVDGTVRLWDLETYRQIHVLDGGPPQSRTSVTYRPDGVHIAATNYTGLGNTSAVHVWRVETGERIATLRERLPQVENLAVSSDSRWMALVGPEDEIRLWDRATNAPEMFLAGHTKRVNAVDFGPGGNLLASGSNDHTVRLWDVSTQQTIAILEGHTGAMKSVAFSPATGMLASGSADNSVRLWNPVNARLQMVLEKHTGTVNVVAFSPTGNWLASGSGDKTAHIWDGATYESIAEIQRDAAVLSLAFSPTEPILAVGAANATTLLWHLEAQEVIGVLENRGGQTMCLAFSPDGLFLATGSDSVKVEIWDVQARQRAATLRDGGSVLAMAWGQSGLVTGDTRGNVLLWSLALEPYSVSPRGKAQVTLGLVKATSLLPNFPNPFNPETWIPYRLGEDAPVQIRIFDEQGRTIRLLDLGHQNAGTHVTQEQAAHWDGCNQVGEPVASGTYFYELRFNDASEMRRMQVVR